MVTVTFFPGRKQVKVRPGTTLLEAARRARMFLPSRYSAVAVTVPEQAAGGRPRGLSAPS